ncbi:MAG: glycosyltransferase family 32 protein [Janthinobacterium lividum]
MTANFNPSSAGSAAHVDLPVFPLGTAIPKLIHQCFFTVTGMPEALHQNVENIKSANPDWQHTLYDDSMMEAFIASAYGPVILSKYLRINPRYGAARVDLFRYLLLYKVGGLYLDVKSSLQRPLDDILLPDDRYILGQWDNPHLAHQVGWGQHPELSHVARGEYQQWHILAAPGHPFLRAVILAVLANIDAYNPWKDGTGGPGTFRVTGPIAYTLAIHPLLNQHPYRMIDTVDAGLVYSIFGDKVHTKLFKSHYFLLTEPLVVLTGMRKFSAQIYEVKARAAASVHGSVRKFKHWLKALLKR